MLFIHWITELRLWAALWSLTQSQFVYATVATTKASTSPHPAVQKWNRQSRTTKKLPPPQARNNNKAHLLCVLTLRGLGAAAAASQSRTQLSLFSSRELKVNFCREMTTHWFTCAVRRSPASEARKLQLRTHPETHLSDLSGLRAVSCSPVLALSVCPLTSDCLICPLFSDVLRQDHRLFWPGDHWIR